MADLVIAAASVLAASGAAIEHGIAGATVIAGQVVALDNTTGRLVLADADGVGDLNRPRGIALNGAASGQPLAIAKSGDVTLSGMTAGVTYYLSPTPGGLAPRADVLAGDYVSVIGIAKSTTVLAIGIQYSATLSA